MHQMASLLFFNPCTPGLLRQGRSPSLGFQLPLRLLVVFGCVDTVLAVIDKVEPRNQANGKGRVSALSSRNALHVGGQLALAVERLAGFNSIHHLSHVHFDFARIFGHAVEPHYVVVDIPFVSTLPSHPNFNSSFVIVFRNVTRQQLVWGRTG